MGVKSVRYKLSWIAAARPPAHETPMRGNQSFDSYEAAVSFMERQPSDSTFVSLFRETVHSENMTREAMESMRD